MLFVQEIKKRKVNILILSPNLIKNLKNIILPLKNVDLKDVDEILYFYMKDQNKIFNYYLLTGQFKLVFNYNQDCKYLITGMINNTTNI